MYCLPACWHGCEAPGWFGLELEEEDEPDAVDVGELEGELLPNAGPLPGGVSGVGDEDGTKKSVIHRCPVLKEWVLFIRALGGCLSMGLRVVCSPEDSSLSFSPLAVFSIDWEACRRLMCGGT